MIAHAVSLAPTGLAGSAVLVRLNLEASLTAAVRSAILSYAGAGARVILLAGRGEPRGEFNPVLSFRNHVSALERELGRPVHFIPRCVGSGAETQVAMLEPGAIALMENLRFQPEAKRRSRVFALRLASFGDWFADLGGAPRYEDGWQNHLRDLLREPPVAANEHR